jgi:hypothetical protein
VRGLASNLRIGPLFAITDVNKVKRSFGLCESQGKVFEVGRADDAAITLHGLAQTTEVGDDFGDNLHVPPAVAALLYDGGAQGVCRAFAALDTLLDPLLLKLRRAWSVGGRGPRI